MTYTNRSDPTQNSWYPRFVSDRADALLDELDEAQVQQLRGALKTLTFEEWKVWMVTEREAIGTYDELTPRERTRRRQKPGRTDALKLHHACLFVELWRARTDTSYCHFPPYGQALDTPELQRAMMLAVMASHRKAYLRDVWPFDVPEGDDPYPFRDPD